MTFNLNAATHMEAMELIKNEVTPIRRYEIIGLGNSLNRILSQDIHSQTDIPGCDNSAVDGYAFSLSDLQNNKNLKINQRVEAGDLLPSPLVRNSAARIFTGAMIPEGANTVLMQEDALIENHDMLQTALKPNLHDHIRFKGSEISFGDRLLSKGHKLSATDLANLSMIGAFNLNVFSPVKICIITTGSEIILNENKLLAGQVYNSNQVFLQNAMHNLPIQLITIEHVDDDEIKTQSALKNAAEKCDLIITTGGASKGEKDFIRKILLKESDVLFSSINIKPGRPTMLSKLNDAFVLSLPGNPLAALKCFQFYGRQIISQLAGKNWFEPLSFKLPLSESLCIKRSDRNVILSAFIKSIENITWVHPINDSAKRISQILNKAEGYIFLHEGKNTLDKGDRVSFIPFSEFL